jgi:hypothetical protein
VNTAVAATEVLEVAEAEEAMIAVRVAAVKAAAECGVDVPVAGVARFAAFAPTNR